ncbi:hypothetical protein TWF106_011668 [Orbilia oligospora]|uniref:Uncharacterized protein n=1 Tax=Orbilia oligospora TaxID=2813651 RepID=A0A6G1LWV7_ORBOL|nr:hypothetical protein TWF788_002022 [Orbilia oligospora]KAF3200493.1 hypothetical protein TWF679_000793 [Orbilia oligospora]KAF3207649.1 hypothetical protein TWF106_011668 [Orbilia oligospora]KAF3213950.1 hypothetical protein TWF191_009947 [Orbilia oligospora]KAF3234803.1 hypothetical protein TWF192_001183 [Orbilia oligospora]
MHFQRTTTATQPADTSSRSTALLEMSVAQASSREQVPEKIFAISQPVSSYITAGVTSSVPPRHSAGLKLCLVVPAYLIRSILPQDQLASERPKIQFDQMTSVIREMI